MKTITTFKSTASYPEQAIVMIFDLEGFSKFFSQPDVHDYVPKYLNIILEAIEILLNGGDFYWHLDEEGKAKNFPALPKHIHSKFLGDGGLYIWKYNDFTKKDIVLLINRVYNLRLLFHRVIERALDEIPLLDIPKNIRFGISAGSVYKLTYKNSSKEEYIGYSINLASRLQSYCSSVGFIVAGRLNIKSSEIEENKYLKLVATKIKGFPQEIVIVDIQDYERLDEETKFDLFQQI